MENYRFKNTEIKTELIEHHGETRLKLLFKYDNDLINIVKGIDGRKWSKTMQCWHIPANSDLNKVFDSTSTKEKHIIEKEDALNYLLSYNNNNRQNINREIPGNNKQRVILYIEYRENLIYIESNYNKDWVKKIKAFEGWWHENLKQWSVIYSDEMLNALQVYFEQQGCNVVLAEKNNITGEKKRIFKKKAKREKTINNFIIQLKLENKSERTIEVYTSFVSQFLSYFKERDPISIETEEIRNYLLEDREKFGYSESYQNQMISAIKSFYRKTYNREFESNILPRPNMGRYLPKVLPRQDVQRMINLCKNRKHRMILFLLYGFGLRVSEVTELKTANIDFQKMRILIEKAKGRKDRVLPIPKVLLKEMKKYRMSYLPGQFFIEGVKGDQYSPTSIQKLVKATALRAGIRQKVSPHILRHCYATHMLEKGTDIRYIQVLLGHKSSKTTEIYTHVTVNRLLELANPMDDIKF